MPATWAALLIAAALVAAGGVAIRLRVFLRHPWRPEQAPARGSAAAGVRYAFTWGMAPWAKESTRIHLPAYLRGIVFHSGIGAGLLALLLAPWQAAVPAVVRWTLVAATLLGALAGWGGFTARLTARTLRAVSTPDDLFAVALVSAFLTAAAAAWWEARWAPAFYVLGAATLVAVPFTKIRHCIYFGFSRYYFGLFYGRRGVIGGVQHE
jgi:nitrate reductase gamma subunit